MESEHIVTAYDEDLKKLDNIIAEMGGLAESQLAEAIEALVRRDAAMAERVASRDRRIDELETQADWFTMRLLALRQPLGQDLRTVIAALKTASDLERIGDYVRNMCNRTIALTRIPSMGAAPHTISRMGSLVQEMIRNVLDAYLSRDVKMATDVRLRDQEVDQLHTSLFRELLTYMMEDPRNITACTHLLFIAKNIERIGDHATNIAEHVHLIVLGKEPESSRPKGDETSFTVVEPRAPKENLD